MILFDFINKPSGFSFSVNAVIRNISKQLVAVFIFVKPFPKNSSKKQGTHFF